MAMDFQTVLASPTATYGEALDFFAGRGMVNQTLRTLAQDLAARGIDYAIIGAVALNQHGYRRFTADIGLLLTQEGLEKFRQELVGRGYRPAFTGAQKKFRATAENVPVDIITSGEYPGDGLPKPVRFPEPGAVTVVIDGINTIALHKLVELKLASGMSAAHRLKDLADVQELIKVKRLDAGFAELLDPSVRVKFIELQQAVADAAESLDY